MTAYYLDSSALVKRYVQEPGTAWVRRITRLGQPNPIYLARITAVEVTSAVARRRAIGHLSATRARGILRRFRGHMAGRYLILEITPAMLIDAMRRAEAHTLRADDAMQLAGALELNHRWQAAGLGGITLVSSDRDLNAAAAVEGLTVEDPSAHP